MNITEIKKGKVLTIKYGLASGQTDLIEYKKEVLGIIRGKYFIDIANFGIYPIALNKKNLKPFNFYVGELESFIPKTIEEKRFIMESAKKVNEWYQDNYENKILDFEKEKQKILIKKKEKN